MYLIIFLLILMDIIMICLFAKMIYDEGFIFITEHKIYFFVPIILNIFLGIFIFSLFNTYLPANYSGVYVKESSVYDDIVSIQGFQASYYKGAEMVKVYNGNQKLVYDDILEVAKTEGVITSFGVTCEYNINSSGSASVLKITNNDLNKVLTWDEMQFAIKKVFMPKTMESLININKEELVELIKAELQNICDKIYGSGSITIHEFDFNYDITLKK